MSTEAMKLALKALEVATTPLAKDRQEVLRAITALQEALAQPQQEPSGWQKIVECPICGDMAIATGIPAAQRKPLTDEELYKVFPAIATYTEANKTLYRSIARAIEAAHGIKEST